MKKKKTSHVPRAIAIGLIVSTMTGCATVSAPPGSPGGASQRENTLSSIFDSPSPCSNNDRNIGMVLGGVTGALVGGLTHGVEGAVVGAVVGVGGGFLVGHFLDARRCELYKIAKANDLKIASARITSAKLGVAPTSPAQKPSAAIGLDVQVENKGGEFAPGTALITPQAQAYLSQIARQYAPAVVEKHLPANATPEQRLAAVNHKILIVGHTNLMDQAISGMSAAKLSQQRARAVATVFAENGVPAGNIYYQGAGDALPIAPVHTARGEKENNRVQIVDVPTVSDIQDYVQRRTVNAGDFVPQPNVSAPTPEANVGPAVRYPIPAPVPVKAVHARARMGAGDGFGGTPLSGNGIPVDLGAAPASHSMFGLISSAQADAPVIVPACLSSHPHPVTAVRNLASGQTLPPRDYVSGFYDAVWVAHAGKNLVAITHANVLKGAGTYVPRPDVLIYKDYHGNTRQAPVFSGKVPVNVYRGQNKTLYRVFVNGPAKCIDMVVPTGEYQGGSRLYYTLNGKKYMSQPIFSLQH
ncbi:OmpA family protein [Acidithiobacillus ferruginosus]|uniref:OmpA family protein n=1 Tax=Acidithiobacillus ferruginosus TaxID=3063951 RepID=A0ACD5IJK5_9PROT|nr:OmpA family protein [Acidithiobacillus ferruginosus]MBU2812975.1 OmpA family protein [Acidithiobacillus ferruginosus]